MNRWDKMCTIWGNLHWETVIHCGAMEALSGCQQSLSWYSSYHRTMSLCFAVGAKIYSYPKLWLQLRPSKKRLIQWIAKYASAATNSTNYAVNSAPSPSGSCPCGPSGSQGLAAFSWRGFGNRDSWDDHPDNTTLTIVNSPSRQGDFHFKPSWNLSKFPVITPIVVSYLDIKQSFLPNLESV